MTLEDLTRRVRTGVPLAGVLGLEVLAASPTAATVRMPASDLSLRPGPSVSGPAMMTLADAAVWVPLLVATGDADDTRTAVMTTTFLRPPGAAAIVAEVEVVRHGRTAVYAEVWMRAEGADKPCAHVVTTWLRAPAT